MSSSAKPAVAAKKKDEDIDSSPPMMVNNLKVNRILDEQKLKV